ncbi:MULTISPECIES: energy transducer TonB [Phenylobacterium]|uniref:Outer membrane biosynthesis protein TonB n=1 Tax=Phenylobacterium koreense TaxID=266125 RepID=A0ABV2EEK6_9CAUL
MSKRIWAAVLAAACVQPITAQAQDTKPDWLKPPSPEDIMAVWPTDAWKRGLGGQAIIACKVNLYGALFDCRVAAETPAGAGFGSAALGLAPQLLMKPATHDGKPVVSEVRVPFNFQKPGLSTGTRIPGAGPYAMPTRRALSNVNWSSAPSYSQVAGAYPEEARAKDVGGRVTLNCAFKGEGRLSGCETVKEEPERLGFAKAAKSLSDAFVGPAVLDDGMKTAGMLTQLSFTFAPEMLDPSKRLVGKPVWASMPSGIDFAEAYPKAAVKAGVTTGKALLSCEVGPGGRLVDCSVQSEEPAALGFGDAALAISDGFRVRQWSMEGLPVVGGRIRVPIRYQELDPAPAPAPAPAAP